MRHCIEVACIEFDEGGNTLWVQGKNGTVLRLKTMRGKFTSKACEAGSHADAIIEGDVHICLGKEDSE